MRRLALALFLCISLLVTSRSVQAQYLLYEPISKPVEVDDGWYKAIVKYTNNSTYTKSTYTLKVKVVEGKVTIIDFGNDGSVHSGYNNEGYLYQGGTLKYDKNYSGEITGVSTRVMTSDTNGIRYFDISM